MDYRTAHLRRLRHSTRLQKRLAVVATLGVLSCAAALLLVRQPTLQSSAPALGVDAAPSGPVVVAAAPPAPATHANARKVYPFSIVPGGVANRAEVLHVLKVDKVVAAHYAAFQVDKVSLVKVGKARAVYVSYRKGDQVYWTAKKVALHEGETLLSDGSNEIRTRCGNRISDTPQLPVAAEEPSQQVLDTAMDADQDDAGLQQVSVPAELNKPSATGSAHVLTSFNGAGLAPADTRTATALAMLGLASGQNGGLAPMRASDGVPLMRIAGQSAQTGNTSATGSADASSGAGGTSGTGGTSTQTGAVDGQNSVSSLPGKSGATQTDTPGGTAPLADSNTPDSGSGAPTQSDPNTPGGGSGTPTLGDPSAPSGGADTPTGMSTPVLGSPPDTPTGTKPELPPAKDPLAPDPSTPIAGTPGKPAADVPEPGSLWLCGGALAALVVLRRRTRRG